MVNGFDAFTNILNNGSSAIIGDLFVMGVIVLVVVVALLLWAGVDFVATLMITGLVALGLAGVNWLPSPITNVVVMVLYALCFGYYVVIFYNR